MKTFNFLKVLIKSIRQLNSFVQILGVEERAYYNGWIINYFGFLRVTILMIFASLKYFSFLVT